MSKKKVLILFLIFAFIFTIFILGKSEILKNKGKEEIKVSPSYKSSVGISNWKIDDNSLNLTEREKTLLEYFDDNYFFLDKYEFLQRYPEAYEGLQVIFYGTVKKILKYEENGFEALVSITTFDGYEYIRDNQDILIKGVTDGARIMENDNIKCYGRYEKVETRNIDGTNYTIPVLYVHRILIDNSDTPSFIRFDTDFIKKVTKAFFGDDVKVRKPIYDQDFVYDELHDSSEFFMIATLDNQSNANFNKYELYQQYGYIVDSNSTPEIIRNICISSDFEHYLLSIYDKDLKEFTLEYYDKDLKKIWSKVFENVINPVYDFTTERVYAVSNNELYVLDIDTGMEVQKPSFIGTKINISKVEDGVILFASTAADSIMKTTEKGSIVWKTNFSKDIDYISGIQVKNNGSIVISLYYQGDEASTIIVIDKNGNKILETSSK